MTTTAAPVKKAGTEIKYHCPKCDLELWHTIVAMVKGQPARIRCNTCKTERNYRAARPESERKRVSVDRPRATGSHPDLYAQKLKEGLMKTPKPYRIDAEFEAEDILDHVKFGRGVVLKLVYPDRMDVLFQDETRTLLRKA